MAYHDTTLKAEEFPVGESKIVELAEKQIGLFRTDEGFFAIDNVCPHRGAPLADGFITEGYVTCPWHQWQFNLKDGLCRNIPGAKVAAFPVELRNGTIWIEV